MIVIFFLQFSLIKNRSFKSKDWIEGLNYCCVDCFVKTVFIDSPSKVSQVLRPHLRFSCFTKQQIGSLKSCQVSKIRLFLIVVFSSFSLTPSTIAPTFFFYPSPPLQIPSAGQLMEVVRVKMKERKVLTEELAMLTTAVSEKA